MSKTMFILGLLLCSLALASAKGDHRPHPRPKPDHDPVERCMKRENCLGDGWHSVCAVNPAGETGAFPNKCFLRCANKAPGAHWEALYSYKTSRHCIRNWQTDPACSACTLTRPEPERRPGHGGKGKGH